MILGLLDGFDDVLVEPFVPVGAVVTHDIGVLLRLSGLDMLDDNPMFLSPNQQLAADVFRAVVDPYDAGCRKRVSVRPDRSSAAPSSTIVSTIIGGHYPGPSRCGRAVRPDAYPEPALSFPLSRQSERGVHHRWWTLSIHTGAPVDRPL